MFHAISSDFKISGAEPPPLLYKFLSEGTTPFPKLTKLSKEKKTDLKWQKVPFSLLKWLRNVHTVVYKPFVRGTWQTQLPHKQWQLVLSLPWRKRSASAYIFLWYTYMVNEFEKTRSLWNLQKCKICNTSLPALRNILIVRQNFLLKCALRNFP